MSYSERNSSIPFRSKKPSLEQRKESKALLPKANECITTTPEKTSQLPNRTRNRGVALSIKDVRKVAEALQLSKHGNQEKEGRERTESVRRQINMSPTKAEKMVDGSAKLPQKYELLCEFFNGLDSSIRLLRLKGSMPSFINIYPKIECLTDRRFTHGHLAQLKFILPEVIEIKKVLSFDERTSCMKPDLHITINADGIKPHGILTSEGGHVSLRKLFRARLADFLNTHSEIDEIPEQPLPEPFNRPKSDNHLEMVKVNTSNSHVKQPVSSKAIRGQPRAATSHISQSFSRRFSQKHCSKEVQNVPTNGIEGCTELSDFSISEPCVPKDFSNGESGSSFSPSSEKISVSFPNDGSEATDIQLGTPVKTIHSKENNDCLFSSMAHSEATPGKVDPTPSRLMSVTPGLHPPKRSFMSPDDDSSRSPNKLVRRPPRYRSLKFDTPVKNVKANIEDNIAGDDILDILPGNLLQSIREKERIAMEEQNPAISQAKRRQIMIACLPKLFNMIHLLFHAINRTVMTKEELVHKIISGNCDIIDRREIEDQLNLLLELVPEWICEKRASSGALLCINKMSNAESIRAQLQEAK